jgi:ribosomal protein S18 acetylase RimI-like enzyme
MKAKQQARKTGITGEEVVRPHDPVLQVRQFTSVDYSELAQIMPPEWFMPGMSETERLAQAQADVASALANATLALVATIDDGTGFDPAVVGFAVARIPSLPALAGADAWARASENALGTLRSGSPVARKAHAYVTQLEERGKLLLDAAGQKRGEDNELLLFAVSPEARGHGTGKALVSEMERRMRDAGAHSYWLQTDTTCSWQWYESHGYERVADVELSEEFVMPPVPLPLDANAREADTNAEDAGADELDVSAEKADAEAATARPHALMYRKNLL